MVASTPRIEFALDFFVNVILICYSNSQISESSTISKDLLDI
jgi:hypothetical protein